MKIRSFLIVLGVLSLIGGAGCGGSSSSDDDATSGLTIQASVAAPSAADISVPLPGLARSLVPSLRHVEEAAPADAIVYATDLAGTVLTNVAEVIPDATTGLADLTGFTTAQLEAGVRIETEYTDSTGATQILHALVYPTAEEITAAATATPPTEPVNTETDLIDAIAVDACGGTLEGCDGTTHNMEVLIELAASTITGDTPDDPTNVDGNMQAVYETYAAEIASGATDTHDAVVTALGGDTTAIVTAVGEAVEAFDATFVTADMVADAGTGLDSMIDTYADPADTTWATLSAVEGFDPAAVVGCIAFLPPDAVAEFLPADFRAVAGAMPDVEGGFAMMAIPDAANACAEGFQQGLFAGAGEDPAKAGTAFGTLTATFPPCPAGGCAAMARTDFTALSFDPHTAGLAAANGFLAMGTITNYALFPPNDMRGTLNSTYSDPTRMLSFANGGGNDFMAALGGTAGGASGGTFVPATFLGGISSPPGGSCTSSAGCLPCDTCNSAGVCVSGSSKMGASCTTTTDCDAMTACNRYSTTQPGQCMCGAALPTGAPVFATGGVAFGAYTPPTGGALASECGTGLPACVAGTTCTSITHGTCNSSTFTFGPGSFCTGNAQCSSGTCTASICSYPTTADATRKAAGEPCSSPADCVSALCAPATHLCEATITGAGTAPTAPAAGTMISGGACITNGDCAVGLSCIAAICTAPPTAVGAGSGCTTSAQCVTPLLCTAGFCTGTTTPPPTTIGTGIYGSACITSTECTTPLMCMGGTCRY